MIVVIIFLPLLLTTLLTFYFFDRVVRYEYHNYNEYWVADGKPIGFFWVPKESESNLLGFPKISSSKARSRYSKSWIFTTPEWTKRDVKARKLLFQYKTSAIFAFLYSLFWIIFVVLQIW